MKIFRLLILIAVFVGYANANSYSPYSFLRYSESARSAGLGGCFVTMTDDVSAVTFNPATIATVTDKPISISFLKHVLDINSGQIAYTKNYKDIGYFAASANYTNYGSFVKSDAMGNQIGEFGSNDLSLGLSYANELDKNLYYGGTVKFIYSNIDNYSTSAMAVDAGLIYQIPDKKVNIGLSILNAGVQLSSYNGVSESLPLDVRLGINHRLKGLPMLVNFSFHHLADRADAFFDRFLNFSIAGEAYFGQYLQVRLGYDNLVRRLSTPSNKKEFSGISAGAGIKTKNFNLDYGLAQIGSSALLHRFSVSFDI